MLRDGAYEDEVDVVVVGAGGAGLSAAIEASNSGAEVLVLEKMPSVLESSSAINAGVMAFAGTDLQRERGVEDSGELLHQDFMEWGASKNIPELVKVYVEHQLDTYEWLKRLGFRFTDLEAAAGMSAERGHVTDPAECAMTLKKAAEEMGARILFQTRGVRLIADEGREIAGVRAEDRNGQVTLGARRGVVLASGGFGRNPQMLEECYEGLSKVLPVTGKGNTGDGLKMAMEFGAGLKNMSQVKTSFFFHSSVKDADRPMEQPSTLIFYEGGFIVNKDGKRYVNESLSYKEIGMATLRQRDAAGYVIFDKKVADGCPADKHPQFNFPRIRPFCAEAGTIGELSSKIGVDPKTLQETVAKYNRYVEAGADPEFGRNTLVAGIGKPIKIDTPPFYAFEAISCLVSTMDAGITVDREMRVLNVFGEVIPRLYAAGEVVGGVHGVGYMTGSAWGKAIIFGRIAGRNAASEKPRR